MGQYPAIKLSMLVTKVANNRIHNGMVCNGPKVLILLLIMPDGGFTKRDNHQQ